MIEFPQSDSRMLPASDRLYRAVVENLDSPGRDTNIDAIIALCMAVDAVENQPQHVELLGWL